MITATVRPTATASARGSKLPTTKAASAATWTMFGGEGCAAAMRASAMVVWTSLNMTLALSVGGPT